MCRKISEKDLLNEADFEGVVLLNYKWGIKQFIKSSLKNFPVEFESMFNNIEYIEKENVIDIVVRKEDAPKDENSLKMYLISTCYWLEFEMAVTITEYKKEIKERRTVLAK